MTLITPTLIRSRARAAFARGEPLAACNMNWHSLAYQTWADEYANLAARAALNKASDPNGHSTPQVQCAPAAETGIDRAQMMALLDRLEPRFQRKVGELIAVLVTVQEQNR